MEYEEFKDRVLNGLQEMYGGNAAVRVEKILRNNGKHYDGIVAELSGGKWSISQVVPVEWFYGLYCSGETGLEGCIQMMAKACEGHREAGFVTELLKRMVSWEGIKGDIPNTSFNERKSGDAGTGCFHSDAGHVGGLHCPRRDRRPLCRD